MPYLYAFDFDHTLIEDNSDVAITSVLDHPVPQHVKSIYNGKNWTEYMDTTMTYIASQGIEIPRIVQCLQQMPFAAGMKGLLDLIKKRRDNAAKSHNLIVLSDANSFFISTILSNANPPVVPDRVITNTARQESGVLRVEPYENQHSCSFCPKNLCKGAALEKYIEEKGPFDVVYYTGDGRNDLCPGLRLRECDFLFVRRGFGLEGLVNAGSFRGIPFVIKARVVIYDDGIQIIPYLRS